MQQPETKRNILRTWKKQRKKKLLATYFCCEAQKTRLLSFTSYGAPHFKWYAKTRWNTTSVPSKMLTILNSTQLDVVIHRVKMKTFVICTTFVRCAFFWLSMLFPMLNFRRTFCNKLLVFFWFAFSSFFFISTKRIHLWFGKTSPNESVSPLTNTHTHIVTVSLYRTWNFR